MPEDKDVDGVVNSPESESEVVEAVPVDSVVRVYSTEEMLAMKQKGFSLSEIGRLVGLTKQGVSQRLKKRTGEAEAIMTFRENEQDILAGKRKLLLDSLTKEDIVRTKSIRDRMVAYGIAVDKSRLLADQSTANIGVSIRWVDLVSDSHRGKTRPEVDGNG
jgi:predicted transcriptional regulator